MAEEIVLPIENYGLFKQRSMLHNCTQMPTLSGNAEVQIATIPKVRDVWGESYIPTGYVIKQAQKCYHWLIYRLENIEDGTNEIFLRNGDTVLRPWSNDYKNKKGNTIKGRPYKGGLRNNQGMFSAIEFTDKDALRWIIIQFDNKCYKFSAEKDFNWNGVINEIPDSKSIIRNGEIIEVYIQGEYYVYYKSLDTYSELSGYSDVFGDWSGVSDFAEKVRDALNNFDKSPILLMTREILDCFRVSHFARCIGRSSGSGNFTPFSFNYWDGIGFVNTVTNRMRGSDNSHYYRWTINPDDVLKNFKWIKNHVKEIIDGKWRENIRPRMYFKDYNVAGTGDDSFEITDLVVYIAVINGFIGGTEKAIVSLPNGTQKIDHWKWFGVNIPIGEPIGDKNSTEDANPYNQFKRLVWFLEKLVETVDSKYQATRFRLLNRGSDDNSIWYVNYIENYLQYMSSGDPIEVITEVNNRPGNPGFTKKIIKPNRGFGDVMRVLKSNLEHPKYADKSATTNFYKLMDSIHINARDTILPHYEKMLKEVKELSKSKGIFDSKSSSKIIGKLIISIENQIRNIETIINLCDYPVDSRATYLIIEHINNRITRLMRYFDGETTYNIDRCEKNMQKETGEVQFILSDHKSDNPITWIETISHMIIAVSEEENRFYYSNPGDTDIEPLNFYTAEYANSEMRECWRLANRLVFATDNTVEFWDITNDFEDPISPAYASNVYSIQALQNSIIRFNDSLYFIGKPIEMDTYGVFNLTKNGQLTTLSYPQLESWINKQLFADSESVTLYADKVTGSVVNIENTPFVMWHLNDDVENLMFNITFNSFNFNDSLFFMANNQYWEYNGNSVGALDKFYEDGYSIPCKIVTTNTNFDGKHRNIKHLEVDIDLDETKRDPKENVVADSHPFRDKRAPNAHESLERFMYFNFDRVSKMPWTSMRKIRLQAGQGNRNVLFKVFGIGQGTDFQTEIKWNGYLRVNKLKLGVE
jgi:hypothetical protein